MSTAIATHHRLGDWSGVLDARAARTNQLLAASAIVLSWWLGAPGLLVAAAAILLVGVVLGPRHIPAYRLYFAVIQPLVGEGRLEDARAPRFAQIMGATGMLLSAALVFAGWRTVGWGLALAIAAAAFYSVVVDFCVGCHTYRVLARLRGIGTDGPRRIDPAEVGLGELRPGQRAVVEFFHPMCHECQQWKQRLIHDERPVAFVDVSTQPELAERHGIGFVPTVVEIDHHGHVLAQLHR